MERSEFDTLMRQVRDALNNAINFTPYQLGMKGQLLEEGNILVKKIMKLEREWKLRSGYPPSSLASAMIIETMKNIAQLGELYNSIMVTHLNSRRDEIYPEEAI